MYRWDKQANSSRKCAVGVLIPDAMYTEKMECGTVSALFEDHPIVRGYLFDVDDSFLRAAQNLHDTKAKDAQNFVVMLDLLASASGLDLPGAEYLGYMPAKAA